MLLKIYLLETLHWLSHGTLFLASMPAHGVVSLLVTLLFSWLYPDYSLRLIFGVTFSKILTLVYPLCPPRPISSWIRWYVPPWCLVIIDAYLSFLTILFCNYMYIFLLQDCEFLEARNCALLTFEIAGSSYPSYMIDFSKCLVNEWKKVLV